MATGRSSAVSSHSPNVTQLVEQAIHDHRIHARMTVSDARALAGRSSAGSSGSGANGSGRSRAPKPWTVADAIVKIKKIIAPCPNWERPFLAGELRGLASLLTPEPAKPSSSARPPRGKPDPAMVNELITFAVRSATMKWHPDRPTGDGEKMKAANAAIEWLRAHASTLNGGRR
jgi:hypothetical protein